MELIDRYMLAVADRLCMDNEDLMVLEAWSEEIPFKMRELHDIINLTYGDVTRGKQEIIVDTNNHTIFFKKYGEKNYEALLVEIYKKIKPTPLYNDNIITFATYIEEYSIYLGVGDVLIRLEDRMAYSHVHFEQHINMRPGMPSLLDISWNEAEERGELYRDYIGIEETHVIKKANQAIKKEIEETMKGEKRKVYMVSHELEVDSYSAKGVNSIEDGYLVKTLKIVKKEQEYWNLDWTPYLHTNKDKREWLFPEDQYKMRVKNTKTVGYVKVYPYWKIGFLVVAYDADMNEITSKFDCEFDKILEVFIKNNL